ncbi:putative polyketide synthase [Xylaria nigripes]|nr:putative polyketide synthase [Xylaria nigripes]
MGSLPVESGVDCYVSQTDSSHVTSFEPIAIIGMAMRLPGRVTNDIEFWNLLSQKKSGLVDIPKNRFNIDGFYNPTNTPGTIPIRQGFFLDDVEVQQFDSSVFPIPRTELERLDPAQRQLLQVAYECFESAGITSWRGSSVGCYVGEFGEDWADVNAKETQHRGGYRGSSFGDFAMSNRISYEFDLRGPSMTVKTACSSSLVGLGLACEAIRNGECDSALVGGTSLIFSPTTFLALQDMELLSPRGQCRTFDATADGYARGEAVNMVLIKKLSHALRDKDPIRAVIRGTGVNSDGRTKGMLTPSPAAQAELIRHTYKVAGIKDVTQTAIVECHGTGTPVGDPLEVQAVTSCFGDKGVIITSVKPNVGHSEGAAGITSLIKNILALEHQLVLPNINFETPNPKIPFKQFNLHVPTEVEAWPKDRAERVSINSFGIGGVNAHVIIESAREFGITQYGATENAAPISRAGTNGGFRNGVPNNGTVQDSTSTNGDSTNGTSTNGHVDEEKPQTLLLFSAYSTASLDAQIDTYREHMKTHDIDITDVAYTLAHKREHKPHRSYAVTNDFSSVQSSITQAAPDSPPRIGWVFTGQGAQWPEMGARLIDSNATFRATINKLDDFLLTLPTPLSWSIESELRKAKANSGVHRAELGHPLCVALQIALVDVLQSWVIKPDFVLGHSSGEVAAAYASGAITAEAAMATATFRGTSNVSTPQKGSMAAVGLGRKEVLPYLEPGVDIACENSQLSVTVSGDTEAVEKVIEKLKVQRPEVFTRMLRVEKAFHSHHMLQSGASYEKDIRPYVSSIDPAIPLYSSVTGKRRRGKQCLDAPYWRANMEKPVLFNAALRTALFEESDSVVLLEIGPHPALAGPIGQILKDIGRSDVVHIGTLSRNNDCRASILHAAGKLYQQSVKLDYSKICKSGTFVTDLPRYAWKQETSHWSESRVSQEWRSRENPPHELLGNRLFEITSEPTWRKVLSLEDASWLAGHEVNRQTVFPAAGYIAMIGEAIQQLTGETKFSVKNVRIAAALLLDTDKTVELVTSLKVVMLDASEASPWYEFNITSWDGNRWSKNCFGEVRATADESFKCDPVAWRSSPFPRRVDENSWYAALKRLGFNYTGLFDGLQSVSAATNTTEAKATVETLVDSTKCSRYVLHPAAIDQCFQLFMAASFRGLSRNMRQLSVPTFIEEMVICHSVEKTDVTAMVANIEERGSFTGNLLGLSPDGQTVISLKGLKTTALTSDDLTEDESPLITQFEWRPHSDFVDFKSCLRRRSSRENEWPLLEELVVLCMLDHHERIKIGETTAEHLAQFYNWMGQQIQRYRSGANPFVPSQMQLEKQDLSQRLARIEEIVAALASSPYSVYGVAIHRLFKAATSIFTGETHPLHVLLEDNILAAFYDAASVDSTDIIRLLANTNPHLRILEVGAGTGGSTARVLQALTSSYGERLYSLYSFTDVSAGFMKAAQERFAIYDNIEYRVFDVTKDPEEQGFQLGSYDLIIAANVIHATPSLNASLGNLHQLLSPGGRLFLEELTPATMFFNYVMGYLPGWWLGAVDNRTDTPWVSPERWAQELVSAGFQEPECIALDYEAPYQVNAAIIASRESRKTVPPRVSLLCHSTNAPYTAEMTNSLQARGIHVDICVLGEALSPEQDVVSVLDMNEPVLHGMTEETFKTVIGYLTSQKQTMLWMTHASQILCEDPRAAMVLGLARTARNELALPLFTIEVETATSTSLATEAITDILLRAKSTHVNPESVDPDYEFSIVNGEILIPRLHWQTLSKAFSQTNNIRKADDGSIRKRLTMKTPGLLHTMQWSDADTPDLGDEDVLVETRAVGLNFRDVLLSLGALENSPAEMGFEGSGIVRAIGPRVTRFRVGDRVMYQGSSCFTSFHVMKEALCVAIEDSMSFEQAAAMPCVYATALMALKDKAHLEKGQSILIHAACGGVGLAAVQIAKMIDAEIYCTVGSQAKRDYLREKYGIQDSHIFNSRNASFLPNVLHATNQRGVDVVLNSLSGDLLTASWRCVAEFGIMVEIGKRDFQRRAKLPMEAFEANRTFTGLELRFLTEAYPRKAAALLEQCVEWIREGKIAGPTISSIYPATQIQNAFRYMQTAKHIGKIVVTMPDDSHHLTTEGPDSDVAGPKPAARFRPDRTYLLVGGLGGLGRPLSTWMAENGARSLVFLSRSAKKGPETDQFIEELASLGCQVQLVAGSVTSKADVMRAVNNAETAEKPIAGVMNLSMVVKDTEIANMTFADWNTAVQPKVQGTWNLHEATSSSELDFFILFSSYMSIIGQWGQANYSAANTFMDAFVQYRHHNGLVASVIDVGVMGEVGFVSRNQDVLDRLSRLGMHILQERNFLDAVPLAVNRSAPSIATNGDSVRLGDSSYANSSQMVLGLNSTVPISAPQSRVAWRRDVRMSIYHNLEKLRGAADSDKPMNPNAVGAQLALLSDDDGKKDRIAQTLATAIANLLNKDEGSIRLNQPLESLGLDSLVAMEVRNWIRQNLGVDLSTITIVQSPSLVDLAKQVHRSMSRAGNKA